MKVISMVGILAGFVALAALGVAPARAQSEIDPDHFEGSDAQSFEKAKVNASSEAMAIRYDGKFRLPYTVLCSGKSLPPGRYSVSLRSDGKVGHATLNQGGRAIGITGVIEKQGSKRGDDDALLVERRGTTRRLSAIQIAELALVIDPKEKIENSANSRLRRVDRLPLTATAQKGEERRAIRKPQGNPR